MSYPYPETITLKTDVMYLDLANEELECGFSGSVQAPASEFDRVMSHVINFLWGQVQTIPAGTVLNRRHDSGIYTSELEGFESVVIDASELPECSYE